MTHSSTGQTDVGAKQSAQSKSQAANLAAMSNFSVVLDGSITTPQGFTAGGLHCGLKKSMRHDLGAILCQAPASAAAVYTLNAFQAAPLKVTRESIAATGKLQAVVINSGNANACTGQQGEQDARDMRAAAAEALGVSEHHVAVASTGVIGELLPMAKLRQGIAELPKRIHASGAGDFCEAILTTDLTQKMICLRLTVDGKPVHIAGAAKGSGMIEPNMATMLGFITTDAVIESAELQQLLSQVTDDTFNMVTVDGDTSTNDMVVAMASGLADHQALTPAHSDWSSFASAFRHVAEYLAKAIARDGEGATKLIEVRVHGATSNEAARAIAKTVIGSSLVKSAAFGADANWGRIIAAIGRSGQTVNIDTVDIAIGPFEVLKQSRPMLFDDEKATEYLQGELVEIDIALHQGEGQATAWGCDLTYEYVRINAAYRT